MPSSSQEAALGADEGGDENITAKEDE